MQIEFLHALHGDKKKNFDTDTAAGRTAFADAVNDALKKGTAIFLERGDGTYMVTGYDPNRDKLKVRIETTDKKTGKRSSKYVAANPKKGKATAVAPVRGGSGKPAWWSMRFRYESCWSGFCRHCGWKNPPSAIYSAMRRQEVANGE